MHRAGGVHAELGGAVPVVNLPGVIHERRARIVELSDELQLTRRAAPVYAVTLYVELPEVRIEEHVLDFLCRIGRVRHTILAGDRKERVAAVLGGTLLPHNGHLIVAGDKKERRRVWRGRQQETLIENRLGH